MFHQFQILPVFLVGWSGQHRVCFFVAEVLPDLRGQNTDVGRFTQASKEKLSQALRGFLGGQVTERGRKQIPLLGQARSAHKHHLQGWDNAWSSGTGLNVTSFLDTALLGPPPNGARRYKIPMSALPPELQSACHLLKCHRCLLLSNGPTCLEFNWADPCRRVTMSLLDQRCLGCPRKIHTHTLDTGLPRLVLVRSASQEAQQQRGLHQTSWIELLSGQWSRMRHLRRLTRRGSFVGSRRLRRGSWTTTIAPTTFQSSVWITMMVCSIVQSTWLRLGNR